ncbi:MAG: DUF2202 domain-containing protein [Rikenellaceae bacterium]
MKRDFIKGTIVLVSLFVAFSCSKEQTTEESNLITANSSGEIIAVKSTGVTTFNVATITAPFDSTADLTTDEIEFLYAVRDDEKLARDIYAIIGKSESTHIKAIERLHDYYQIEYPPVGESGKFVNSQLQSLYDSLLVKGVSQLETVCAGYGTD